MNSTNTGQPDTVNSEAPETQRLCFDKVFFRHIVCELKIWRWDSMRFSQSMKLEFGTFSW